METLGKEDITVHNGHARRFSLPKALVALGKGAFAVRFFAGSSLPSTTLGKAFAERPRRSAKPRSAVVVVAELRITTHGRSNVRVFRSGSGQWEAFENLDVHGAIVGRRDKLRWWSSDAVVLYGHRRYMMWAD